MARICSTFASALAGGTVILMLAGSVQAQGINADVGVSIGGGSGINADADASIGGGGGVDADADASIGGGGGVDADADVSVGGDGGADADVGVSAGGGDGVDADVSASIGDGADADVGLSIGGGGGVDADVGLDIGDDLDLGGGLGLGDDETGLGVPGPGGNPPGNQIGEDIDNSTQLPDEIADLNESELMAYQRRCGQIIANPSAYDRGLVELCAMVQAAN